MKHFLFIALVVLAALPIVPVSAYTELQVDTYADTGLSYASSAWNIIRVVNCTAFTQDVTKIHFEISDTLGAAGQSTGGTYNAAITYVAGTGGTGNASVTWSTTGTYGGWGIVTADVLINDLTDVDFDSACDIQFSPTFFNSLTRFGNYSTEDYQTNKYSLYITPNALKPLAGTYTTYSGTNVTSPAASFTCSPTSQFPDTNVVCTDTSTGGELDWLWTIDAEAMGIDGWQTATSQNFTWQSAYPGLYSVNLRVNNSVGFDWENKSSYVSISENATPNNCNIPPLAGYSRTSFQCTDSMSSAAIIGCDIQLHDLEGGSWSNVTGSADGKWCIDTLPSHHINGYGQSTGYTDGTRLNVQEWNGQTYTILMIPGYVPPAADGYVWVYVHVTDWSGSQDISGASVSISATGKSTVQGTTDSSGIVHLQFPNATESYINTAKAGYTTAMTVITTSDFGPDTVNVKLHAGTQTMTIVPTTGPGGTVPTTASPWGTPGPYGTMPSGYTNAQGQMAMDYLAANGLMLVQLCVLVTICALLGFKFGK